MTDREHNLARVICDEIATAVESVTAADRTRAIEAIRGADRIFVFGEGRSGLALRMAAMRLVHLGLNVHVVGDATTPAIVPGDILIVGSGSGETPVTLSLAKFIRIVARFCSADTKILLHYSTRFLVECNTSFLFTSLI